MAVTVNDVLDAAQRLPVRPLREALEDRPFIVVAPHPDDESLGCGGLIAAFCMNGSLYAMLVYLVLYLQDDLGYSALSTHDDGYARATAHVQGPKHLMNIVVTPICRNKINIQYTMY